MILDLRNQNSDISREGIERKSRASNQRLRLQSCIAVFQGGFTSTGAAIAALKSRLLLWFQMTRTLRDPSLLPQRVITASSIPEIEVSKQTQYEMFPQARMIHV
jgi:hypothetical protein